MGIVRRGDAGADVEELGDPGLGGKEAEDSGEERPVGSRDSKRAGSNQTPAKATTKHSC
jgi:hypothetical protein